MIIITMIIIMILVTMIVITMIIIMMIIIIAMIVITIIIGITETVPLNVNIARESDTLHPTDVDTSLTASKYH